MQSLINHEHNSNQLWQFQPESHSTVTSVIDAASILASVLCVDENSAPFKEFSLRADSS